MLSATAQAIAFRFSAGLRDAVFFQHDLAAILGGLEFRDSRSPRHGQWVEDRLIDQLTIDVERQRIYFYDFYRAVARLFTDSKTAPEVTLLRRSLAGFCSRRAQPVLATSIVRAVWRGTLSRTHRFNNAENLP